MAKGWVRAAKQFLGGGEAEEGEKPKKSKEERKKERLLNVLKAQRERSIGFDHDKDINDDRADALDYYKGKHAGAVSRDLPAAQNRSTVVSPDVANDIEQCLPDVVEIFTAGEDVITFDPQNDDDTEAAEQETDYVRHIVFQQNRGWWIFYTVFKDALLSKTGIFHFYWKGDAEYEEYETTATEPQIEEIEAQGNEIVEIEATKLIDFETGYPKYKVSFRKQCSDGHVVIEAVSPENFTFSPETTLPLSGTNYCAMRVENTRQAFIDEGYDKAIVMKLNSVDDSEDQEKTARDTVAEHNDKTDAGDRMLDIVEVVVHYIRHDLYGDGKTQIWRVVTGNGETVELECEKRARIEFAAVTPFPMPHRFTGQSLADKTLQTQKWKTSVYRAANDHLYFSNNQRQEVKKAGIVPGVTIEQLVENTPGSPVITEDGQSLKPVQNGPMAFDPLRYVEHINTEKENTTGQVRNAAGLTPDTMHETKGGAEIILSASQKRNRMMARVFAETGVRDLYVGVHDLARENATMTDTIELRGKWVDIAPNNWRRRKDATIDIGIGSGGKEQDLAGMREYTTVLEKIGQAQGGYDTPGAVVNWDNIYAFADKYGKKLGLKGHERFITDPRVAKMMDAAEGKEPPEDPLITKAKIEVQAKLAIAQQEGELKKQQAMVDAEIEQMKAKAKIEQEQLEMEQRMAIKEQEAKLQMKIDTMKAQNEIKLAREKAAAEIMIAQQRMQLEVQSGADMKEDRPGGSLAS